MKTLHTAALLVLAFLGVPFAGPVAAQLCTGEITQPVGPATLQVGNFYGGALATDGVDSVVGTPGDDDLGPKSGSAYVFRRATGWATPAQKLYASDGAADAFFGYAAAIQGDLLVIGAPGAALGSTGKAYVFRRHGVLWVEEQVLHPDAPGRFGWSISIDAGAISIGAWGEILPGGLQEAGAAYVFRHDGTQWVKEQKLVAPDAAAGDRFGTAVSIRGDTALIGAFWDDVLGFQSGSAYVFRRIGGVWVLEQKLLAADGAAGDYFGLQLALGQDLALVASYLDDEQGVSSGSVHAFRRIGSSWSEEQKLLAPGGKAFDNFGSSLDVDAGVAVIGAYADDVQGAESGVLEVFRYDGQKWLHRQTLTAADGVAGDFLGASVALSGKRLLVQSSNAKHPHSYDIGKVYVHQLNDLALDATKTAIAPGETTEVRACGGMPGGQVLLIQIAQNGAPVTVLLAAGVFGPDGTWATTLAGPPTTAGTVVLRAVGSYLPFTTGASNTLSLSFL